MRDSAYPIPAGALFVAPNGSDASVGTVAAPFLTISHAVAAARSAGTIVVRGGTYRESLGYVTKQITIQAYPHEQVWMKGSVPVSGFTQSGGAWVKRGWTPALCHSCYPSWAIDPAHPAAGLPDQVFVDGQPLAQVMNPAALAPGAFYVDTANHQLELGADPAGHAVEATSYSLAMQFQGRASGSKLLGIGVAQYGPHFNMDMPAMVVGNATNLTFDRDAFDWSATRGLSVFKPGAVVTHSDFFDDGANALHANRADGLTVTGNRFVYANFEQFSIAPSATASVGAVKITYTGNALVKWNYFGDNDGIALWFDLDCFNITIANNLVVRNAQFGIYYEVSTRALIAGNVAADNGWDGVRVIGSTNTRIWNNTMANNGGAQLGVDEDRRTQTDPKLRAQGFTWDAANISVFNNVLAGGPNARALWDSFDSTSPRHLTSPQMVPASGNNVFVRPTASQPASVASWQTTLSTTTRFPTLAAFQVATGREQGSIAADAVPLTNTFTDPFGDHFTLTAKSPALARGLPLPADVAAAMSVNGSVHVGAVFPGVAPPG